MRTAVNPHWPIMAAAIRDRRRVRRYHERWQLREYDETHVRAGVRRRRASACRQLPVGGLVDRGVDRAVNDHPRCGWQYRQRYRLADSQCNGHEPDRRPEEQRSMKRKHHASPDYPDSPLAHLFYDQPPDCRDHLPHSTNHGHRLAAGSHFGRLCLEPVQD